MAYFFSIALALFALFQPLPSQGDPNPVNWGLLTKKIQSTKLSQASSLQGFSVDLVVPGATEALTLAITPERAFKVERLGITMFRVTIVEPQVLVNKEKEFVQYYPVGWRLEQIDKFKIVIDGEATCRQYIEFNQTGVGKIDLRNFDARYVLTPQFTNSAVIASLKRLGKGYEIIREPGSTSQTSMRLRIKEKDGDIDLQTDWVPIPACNAVEPDKTPSAQPTREAPTVPVSVVSPADLIDIKYTSLSHCQDGTGRFCATLYVTVTNNGTQLVRCNEIWFYMKYDDRVVASTSHWVDLAGGEITRFEVSLVAPYKPQSKWSYSHKKTQCSYK